MYISTKKALELSGVHQNTLYNWIRRGIIRAVRGKTRRWRIDRDSLVDALGGEPEKRGGVEISPAPTRDDLRREAEYMRKNGLL